MKRGIQCPERGRDQLALLLLDFAYVQAIEVDRSWPHAQPENVRPNVPSQRAPGHDRGRQHAELR